MIASDIRQGLRTGMLLAIVVVFLFLIGATSTLADILAGALKLGRAVSLQTVLALLALWLGSQAAKVSIEEKRPRWINTLLRAAVAGLSAGLVIGLTTLVFLRLHESGINLRTYLYQLSPDSLDLWSLGRSAQGAAVFHFLLPLVGCLLGAVLARGFREAPWRSATGRRVGALRESITRPLATAARTRWGRILLYAALGAVLILLPLRLNNYWNFTLGTVGIYVLMGLGLNIVVGLAGLLDLGYVVFFAVGSYTIGLLTAPTPHHLMWDFWIVLPIAIFLAAIIGVLLGIPVLRLRGDYLAIVTLGFGEIIRVLLKAEALSSFSNGPRGIPSIGQPAFFGLPFNSSADFMYMIIFSVLLVIFLTNRLQNSRVGRAWIAIREDETVARAMGINTLTSKLLAFGIGAAFAGLGGVLFASRSQFTGPDDFNLMVSINVLAVVIVGGMGSIPGVIAGAFVLKGLPEVLRELDAYRILSFGALLVAMMVLRPEGLIPSTRRRLEMQQARAAVSPPATPVSPPGPGGTA
jgi:branched-chain amino acid transport system permease protein